MIISRTMLESMKTGRHPSSESLPFLLSIAGIKIQGTRKADMVEALYSFYNNENNLLRFWNQLQGLDRELLEEYIRSSGGLEWEEIQQIFEKHGQKANRYSNYSWQGVSSLLPERSPAKIFFIGRSIPDTLIQWLGKRIPPLPVLYEPVPDKEAAAQSDFILTMGETSHQQFVRMIRTVGQLKLKAAASSGLPTKAAVVKFQAALMHKEPLLPGYKSISDIRTIEHTTWIYGMFQLLYSAGVLASRNEQLVLGQQAEAFLQMNSINQIDFLTDAYLHSIPIKEWNRIPEIKVRTEYAGSLEESRRTLFFHLTNCPPYVWINTSELLHYVKKTNRSFLYKCVGELLTYDDYHRGYYSGYYNWEQLEGRVIEVMLLEYLTALGIVDTAISAEENEEGNSFFSVSYFRITRLGAHILGIEELEAETRSGSSGFIVQPNFDIVISEGRSRQLHQLFFDRFASLKADDVVTIYNIDFAGIVKATNNNITVQSIIDYLTEHNEYELPANVTAILQDWANKSGKIRIRQVTIVETEDELLLQELLNSKPIRKFVTGELNHAFEIDSSSASKVKREIEKKNYLCD